MVLDAYLIPDLAGLVYEWLGKDYFTDLLCKVSKKGNVKGLTILLEELNMDINTKDNIGRTALHVASQYGHKEIVKMLIEKGTGADINLQSNSGRTALHYASIIIVRRLLRCCLKMVQTLIFKINGVILLFIGLVFMVIMRSLRCYLKRAMTLIQNDSGYTALYIASCNGHKDIIEMLKKAVPNRDFEFLKLFINKVYNLVNDGVRSIFNP